MRSPLFTRKRRTRRATTSTTIAKPRRSASATAPGGPVNSTEYIGRGRRRPSNTGGRNRGTGVLPRPHTAQMTRRIVLTVLICASFGLITATYRGGSAVNAVQSQVLEVVAPIQRGLSRAWDPVAGAWNWTGNLFQATGENPKLKEENEQLRTRVNSLKVVEAENRDLQRIVNFEGSTTIPSDLERVHSRIMGRNTSAGDRPLVIDVGSAEGVQVDDPVMGVGGLIGIITKVNDHGAIVQLINDNAQNVGAMVQGSNGAGGQGVLQVVSSDGVPALRLTSVQQDADVAIGDVIVTSGFFDPATGLSSKYPGNLLIGFVSDVGDSPGDLTKTIQVTPYADFENLTSVTVLVHRDANVAKSTMPVDEPSPTDAEAAAR